MGLNLMPIELVISPWRGGDTLFPIEQFAQSPLASDDGEGINEHIALDGPAGDEQCAQGLGQRWGTADDLTERFRRQARLGGRQRQVKLAFQIFAPE